MNTTRYDHSALAAASTSPGERIPGPPSGGLATVAILWLAGAAPLFLLGGMIFVGILKSVSGAG